MMSALRIFFFLLPFQFALPIFEGIDLPLARVCSAGLIIVWLWLGLIRRNLHIDWDVYTGCFLSFWFMLCISVWVAVEPFWALRKILFLISFLPLYFVIKDVINRDVFYYLELAKAFVYGAIGSAGVGMAQFSLQFFLSIEQLFPWWTQSILPFFLGKNFAGVVSEYPSLLVNLSGITIMRASAFFPDPHMHAFYLGLALPIGFFFAWRTQSVGWLLGTILILVADILTFSRGSYLGLLVAFCTTTLLFRQKLTRRIQNGIWVSISIIMLIVLIPNPITERFWSGFSLEDGSVSSRLVIYTEALQYLQEYPLVGVGLGNYPLVVKPTASEREPIYAHSVWLDIAVETGLLGLVFFVGFFFLTLYRVYYKWESTRNTFSLAVLASLTLFFGHSLVETPIFSVQVLPALLCVLAFGNRHYGKE